MNAPGRGERVPIPAPGEEEVQAGREQPASTGVAGPEQRAPTPPPPADQEIVTSPVPSSVDIPIAPTKINTAAPAAPIDLQAVSEGGFADGSKGASALVQGLNTDLEAGPESGKPQE